MKKCYWEVEYRCDGCKKSLSRNTIYGSQGVCPLCGASSDSPIIDYHKVVRRAVLTSPWWNFWNPKLHWEYKEKEK